MAEKVTKLQCELWCHKMIFSLTIGALAIMETVSSQVFDQHGIDEQHKYDEHDQEGHHLENEPNYRFEYRVKDEHSGDFKIHKERRKGDDVEGYYSLVEPDGTLREVRYTSAKHEGFKAVVTKSGKPVESQKQPETKLGSIAKSQQQDIHEGSSWPIYDKLEPQNDQEHEEEPKEHKQQRHEKRPNLQRDNIHDLSHFASDTNPSYHQVLSKSRSNNYHKRRPQPYSVNENSNKRRKQIYHLY